MKIIKIISFLAIILAGGLIVTDSYAMVWGWPPSSFPGEKSQSAPIFDAASVPSTSSNWAGYVAAAGTFTAVSGTWTVPTSTAAGSALAADATWVGIGGVNSRDLIQAGTQAITSRSGTVSYTAWVEKLPGSSRAVSLSVNPGDSITATLEQQSGNSWKITIKNNTTGNSFQTSTVYNSSLSSAEWIQERPSTRAGFIALDAFGSVQFSNAWTIQNGAKVNLAQTNAKALTMTNLYHEALATPTALTADGASFSVTRTATSSVSTPTFAFGRHNWRFRMNFGRD